MQKDESEIKNKEKNWKLKTNNKGMNDNVWK